MKLIEAIEKWVSKRGSFYFFLPNGPYGRPFDNQYSIVSISSIDKGLKIEFNDGLALYFIGEPEVIDEGCNLLITKYDMCHFKDKNQQIKSFDYGEVVLNGF